MVDKKESAYVIYEWPPSKTKWLDYLGWGLMAYGIWGLFHFIFLQPLATLTYANLNSLLCPAITDPFYGKNYRSYGIVHQFFITLVFGCVSNFISNDDACCHWWVKGCSMCIWSCWTRSMWSPVSVSQSQPCCLEPKQAVAAIPEELGAQTRIATMPTMHSSCGQFS